MLEGSDGAYACECVRGAGGSDDSGCRSHDVGSAARGYDIYECCGTAR